MASGLFGSRAVILSTSLSPEECARRLTPIVDHPWDLFGSNPVVGDANKTEINLRKRISGRNSFQTLLKASLEPDGDGTRLHCDIAKPFFSSVFMACWLGFVGIAWVITLIATFAGANEPASGIAGIVLLPVFAGFGYTLVLIGQGMARGEDEFLIDFLCRELGARRLEAPPAQPLPAGPSD
jgi:hypothetical protein